MLAAMWGSVFSSTRMATELVGVAWKNNMVKLDVNNLLRSFYLGKCFSKRWR